LPELRAARSYESLIQTVETIIGSVPGIGELAVYDIALRIGARFGLEPEQVYLHRGTRAGAAALGMDAARPAAYISELPAGLRALIPREAEDTLCIYKSQLTQIAAGHAPDLPSAARRCVPSPRQRRQPGCGPIPSLQ
jgi:hypothetical protein